MKTNNFLVFIASILLILSINLASAATFQFNGTVKDESGRPLNNSLVNITVRGQDWSILGQNSTTSNSSGWFNLSMGDTSPNGWVYELAITHFNQTFCDYRSKTIPAFNYNMMLQLAGTTFYLTQAGTINLTAINSSGGRTAFQYQIKDTKLGYPIASNMGGAPGQASYVSEAVVYVPRDRNYSIMIYPNQSMPVSFDWSNFSSANSYTFGNGISSYNHTTKTLAKQFNTTMNMMRVSGYLNSSIIGWDEFTVVPYLLEPGNMVHSEYGDMPYNLSSFNWPPGSDTYNLATGFYNISLPAPVESSTILLFATARNSTSLYGGFRNISPSYNPLPTPPEITQFNFTHVTGLLGDMANITLDVISQGPGQPQSKNITTKKQTFNIQNASSSVLTNTQGHIETTLDYSRLGAIEFTWMIDISQSSSSATFSIPLLNSTGIKEMNVFVSGGPSSSGESKPQQYTPKTTSFTVSQIQSSPNIIVRTFNPGGIGQTIASGDIEISMYISNSTCDIPEPNSSCLLGAPGGNTMASFNPMQAVMGGGKLSFRMGTKNVSVHYVNVDLIASGPPDAAFDNSTSRTTQTGFAAALRFGSSGPKIYDYALVSIPYSETSGVILNDTAPVNISIPLFYNDTWGVIWNVSDPAQGANAAALAGNDSHYADRQSEWANLTTPKTCTRGTMTNSININATSPCYIDATNNKIWIRLPHFSGTGPEVQGDIVAPTVNVTSISHNRIFNNTYFNLTILATSSSPKSDFCWFNITNLSRNVQINYTVLSNDSFSWNGINATYSSTISGMSDGNYTIQVNCTDSENQSVKQFLNFSITDITPPTATGSSSSVSTTSATISATTDEIALCKYSTNSTANFTQMNLTFSTTSSTSHSQALTGLTASTTYNYYVLCNDTKGNAMSSATTISFTTSSSGSTTGDGTTGGTASGGTAYWILSYPITETNFVKGQAVIMYLKWRLHVKIDSKDHYVGIVNLTSTTAKINVSSTSKQKILAIGEAWKVEVTDDNYYDILVTLNNITGTKANVSIKKMHELITTTPASTTPTTQQNQTQQPAGSVPTQTAAGMSTAKKITIIIISVVAVIIAGIACYLYYLYYRKKRYYNHGY